MNDFIALEKSRFDDRVDISIVLPKDKDITGTIPPLILVPFVENAFKHSLKDKSKKVSISIKLDVIQDGLSFSVKNSKDDEEHSSNSNNNGLGLLNITKRLDIVYGKNYDLKIDNLQNEYSVNLKIFRK
jgi:LytS/YehU family sensor histidine kinase